MTETVSRYKNYVTASKKKVYLANIADYLLTFILTFLLFAVAGSPILGALPVTQNSYAVLSEHVKTLYEMIDDTHLQTYDSEKGTLSNLNLDGRDYATTLAKTSYYVLDLGYPKKQDDGTYLDIKVDVSETFLGDRVAYPLDAPSYYFLSFKAREASLNNYVYDGTDYASIKDEYLYKKAFGYADDWFAKTSEELPLWQQLNKDRAMALTAYLVYDDSATVAPYETYKEVLRGYKAAINTFVAEVEKNYAPMLKEVERFNAALREYDGIILVDYNLCFLAAILILEVVLPLCLRQGRTIGMRAIKVAYATDEEMTPSFWRYLIKVLMRVLLHYSSLFFCLMITSSYSIAFVSFGWFSLAIPLIISGLLGIGSLVMIAVRKSNQGLAEFAARLETKDTTQMEEGDAIEDKKA